MSSHPWRVVATCLLFAATAAAEPPSANDCMSFESNPQDKSIDYRLTNGCDRRVACTVTWKLHCGDGTRTKTVVGGASRTLERSQSDSVTASAEACGKESWEIADVGWSCASG